MAERGKVGLSNREIWRSRHLERQKERGRDTDRRTDRERQKQSKEGKEIERQRLTEVQTR